MVQQDKNLRIQEYLKWYSGASASEKKEAREKMQVCFKTDTTYHQQTDGTAETFDDWCETKKLLKDSMFHILISKSDLA